ncbi:HTH-type transcriptional regulator MhqR [Microbacterium oxydans]|uniref:HTH-type transcriptional regulator MhqR n=1 Tax=Microbacterium oxydans TaxID=82380 RepID=A0A3Q9J572_9MICO|nr:MarR family transcriptional regulator [Microbacterium oxydans]AZS40105.1 HTH-type transcriptional regulator MhqR [Microbacterium oxydans]
MDTDHTGTAPADALAQRIIEAMPDWVNTMIHLNGLIADRMNVVPADFQCLHAVVHDGPTTAGQIAQRVTLTPGAVSRAIDRLESANCVRRIPDPSDRRRTLIEATPDGLATITRYYAGMTARTENYLSGLSHQDLDAVLRFIDASRDGAAREAEQLRDR